MRKELGEKEENGQGKTQPDISASKPTQNKREHEKKGRTSPKAKGLPSLRQKQRRCKKK
jgi:hypothetical protein